MVLNTSSFVKHNMYLSKDLFYKQNLVTRKIKPVKHKTKTVI